MKPRVKQAAAEFLQEVSEMPDQVLQQFTFRLKRCVKGLHQVVSDLELPVASVLSVELECICKANGTAGITLQDTKFNKAHREQAQQQAALQDFTQVSIPSTLVIAFVRHWIWNWLCWVSAAVGCRCSNILFTRQASMSLVVSTIERAQVEAMLLLSQTSEMPAQQVSSTAQIALVMCPSLHTHGSAMLLYIHVIWQCSQSDGFK